MKITFKSFGLVTLTGGLVISGCAHQPTTPPPAPRNPAPAAPLKSFVAEKEAQANAFKMPSEFRSFFAVASQGDWPAVSNAFIELRKEAGQHQGSGRTAARWRGPAWQAVVDTWGALRAFGEGDEGYFRQFGTNVIASVPAGSIYFGGTEAGRFIITALQKSHAQANPFFTLAQGSLTDPGYREYLRSMYGERIYIPTDDDSKRVLQEYTRDVARRRKKNQLRPGETANVATDGEVTVSGMMAMIQVNALLTKLVFDKNPTRECYIEESFPFDWLYPHLEPHGLIFRISREPLPGLSEEIVEQDRKYWQTLVRPMIGDWLTDDTPVNMVAAFAEKTFGEQDLQGFSGDAHFIRNAYSQRMFSKLRSALGGLYAWRRQQATAPTEKEWMGREADFAFRQAWALCPDSTDTVLRYVALLMDQKRIDDALLVAETAADMPSIQGQEGQQICEAVVKEIQKAKQQAIEGR